jgi:methyl-accepting chemotaxis protein
MAAGAEQIDSAVHKVNDISIKNKRQIDLLIAEVSRFKVDGHGGKAPRKEVDVDRT